MSPTTGKELSGYSPVMLHGPPPIGHFFLIYFDRQCIRNEHNCTLALVVLIDIYDSTVVFPSNQGVTRPLPVSAILKKFVCKLRLSVNYFLFLSHEIDNILLVNRPANRSAEPLQLAPHTNRHNTYSQNLLSPEI
jgi:hypothetical protein